MILLSFFSLELECFTHASAAISYKLNLRTKRIIMSVQSSPVHKRPPKTGGITKATEPEENADFRSCMTSGSKESKRSKEYSKKDYPS